VNNQSYENLKNECNLKKRLSKHWRA